MDGIEAVAGHVMILSAEYYMKFEYQPSEKGAEIGKFRNRQPQG